MNRTYRIGQIVPSSNTTMETEIPALLRAREAAMPQESFTFHSSRMRMHRVTLEELAKMNTEGARCAAELADARVDVMSTACLVAIMASGPGYHRQVEQDLASSAQAAGASSKVMTSAGALIEGLKALGARKIAFLAPYTKPLAQKVVDYIQAEDIEVHDWRTFEIADNLEVAQRDPIALLDDMTALDVRGLDAVVLSACVQMRSLPAIELAQQRLGLPVTSTAICTTWLMLKKLGLAARAPGGGALLDGRAA
jgi:maleate isomerase